MTAARSEAEISASYTGRLVAPAQCRMRAIDDAGHMVPVLCLEIELECTTRNRLHAEQPFPADAVQACEAAARRHHVGEQVTVNTPLAGVRLVAPMTQHVHVLHPPPTTTEGAP